MVKYIIKIVCTHKEDLVYNGKKIRESRNNSYQSPPDMTLGYISCIFQYIKDIKIVYKKTLNNLTTKRLELYCDSETHLSDEDFFNLIEILTRLGFYSENNVKVSYCSIENKKHEEIKAYTFTSLINIIDNNDNTQRPKRPNRSKYITKQLYMCKNLIL